MTSIESRIDRLRNQFQSVSDWEARYRMLIELGRSLPSYPDSLRSEELKVKGCTSQVWLHAHRTQSGGIEFQADSDSSLVKGLVAMLIQVYSGSSPDEILSLKPEFLKELGFDTALTPSRANGLYSMVRQIYLYAHALKSAAQ